MFKKLYIVSRQLTEEGRESVSGVSPEYNIMDETDTLLLPYWALSITRLACGLFIVHSYSEGDDLIDKEGVSVLKEKVYSVICTAPGSVTRTDDFGFKVIDHYDRNLAIFKVQRKGDHFENYIKGDGTLMFPDWYQRYETLDHVIDNRFLKVFDKERVNFIDIITGELVYPDFFEKTNHDWKAVNRARETVPGFLAIVKHEGRWKTLDFKGQLKLFQIK